MNLLDRWTELLDTLARHRLRTVLTALSVAWGIYVLVLLVGLGDGLKKGVAWQFRDDATNSVWIYRGRTTMPYRGHAVGRQIQFTNADFERVLNLDDVVHATGRFYLWGEGTISYKDRTSAFSVRAVHPDHQFLENTIVTSGRYLNDLDIDESRKVTVIGAEVSKYLFRGADPLGEWVDINRIAYRVVGVFEDEGGPGELRQVYIPITTAQDAYAGGDQIHQLMFTVDESATNEKAEAVTAQIRHLLARAHHFNPEDRRAMRVRNNVETFEQVQGVLQALQWFTLLVGLGTVVAGVVGVSNIMLVSVAERTSEFGLRKALGATPSTIVWMVLQEAVVLTGISGWAGLTGGLVTIEACARFLPPTDYIRDPAVDIGAALAAVFVVVVAGAAAGFFPAYRAASIEPVEALRG